MVDNEKCISNNKKYVREREKKKNIDVQNREI